MSYAREELDIEKCIFIVSICSEDIAKAESSFRHRNGTGCIEVHGPLVADIRYAVNGLVLSWAINLALISTAFPMAQRFATRD